MSNYQNIKCPICSTNITDMCDNDCGTVNCCNREFYYENNTINFGHNPKCGMDNDDFIDDNIEIK